MRLLFNAIIEYKIDNSLMDLDSYGLENFSELSGRKFSSKEEAKKYIKNYKYTLDEIAPYVEFDYFDENILIELFPIWKDYWESNGIKETIKIVRIIYNRIKKANINDIDKFLSEVNIAINTAHKTGKMIEYIEDYDNVFDLSSHLL